MPASNDLNESSGSHVRPKKLDKEGSVLCDPLDGKFKNRPNESMMTVSEGGFLEGRESVGGGRRARSGGAGNELRLPRLVVQVVVPAGSCTVSQ